MRTLAWKAMVRKKPDPQDVKREKSSGVDEGGTVELLVVGEMDEG